MTPSIRTMNNGRVLTTVCMILTAAAGCLQAQDTRKVAEPTFPRTCRVYPAPLQSTAGGPAIGPSAAEQDNESDLETSTLKDYLQACPAGQAVELALGVDNSFNAFLLDPITLPAGVSLILDGGVTVYGSRDPERYQDQSAKTNSAGIVCGTVGPYPVSGGCVALISLLADSGIYGYGVIDGQGNRALLTGDNAGTTWWDMAFQKKHSNNEQASPKVINAGTAAAEASNIVLYKITVRNPPFHTIGLGGDGFTVWGMKVQAPWTVPNTDGFDIHGTNMTFYDTTVANGDQEIAITTNNIPTANITVNHFHGYSKGGLTILAGGDAGAHPTKDIVFQNVTITGDLPSVAGTTVNGVPEATLMQQYGLKSYGQALPNATNELKALQITTNTSAASQTKPGNTITNVTFKSVCIQDIVKPINITPIVDFTSDTNLPTIQGVTFKDVHVLPPTPQFPSMNGGIPFSPVVPGAYQVVLKAYPNGGYLNGLTLDNVVFDDTAPGVTSVVQITAIGNVLTTKSNVYPSAFNELATPSTGEGVPALTTDSNSYDSTTSTNNQSMAYPCSLQKLPFTTGDLYVSAGSSTNLQNVAIHAGDSVTLNAVVQPIMSQTTFFNPKGYGSDPGLLAVGSPALTNPVEFYEGDTLLGKANLSANGTLASLVVNNVPEGWHTFRAQYPADSIYGTLRIGKVIVYAQGQSQ